MGLNKWLSTCAKRKTTYKIPGILSGAAASVVTTAAAIQGELTWVTTGTVATAGLLWLGGVGEFVVDFFEEETALSEKQLDESRRQSGLEAALFTIYHNLLEATPSDKDAHGLRLCIHLNQNEAWSQATNYIGDCHEAGKGNTIDFRRGITGECIRTGKLLEDHLRNGQNIIDFSCAKYGYTREEAARLNPNAKSWVAAPIGQPPKVMAVLFGDCQNAVFWGNKSSKRMSILKASVLGISEALARSNETI